MKGIRCLSLILFLFLLAACQKDIPEPETKLEVEPVNTLELATDMPVSGVESSNAKNPFYVRHQVRGKDVLVECILQGVSFSGQTAKDKGKILLYVDGIKKEEISSAAFIVKGLSSGNHRIRLELVKEKQPSLKLKREFYVSIP
ncbi:hypothetical protein J7I93_06915 [Bacillus sp. ISL-47]|uniref:hypothetical protein n=1 Tax=Bacillus sp. ISL-47 TaxID=2819130 RepID=UPI001BE9E0C9|nr:hypothetical protein [Bacillus sp. ISL-47]MBT2687906.1 hypothetical protein [Bacillus sp. ISL-47]MBT2708017.1 hypothetical protein [Pseudomonas sp. ISL-84]